MIKKLREVLGDSAENPRFIETLPRLGYRFLGHMERLKASRTPPAIEESVPAMAEDGTGFVPDRSPADSVPDATRHRTHRHVAGLATSGLLAMLALLVALNVAGLSLRFSQLTAIVFPCTRGVPYVQIAEASVNKYYARICWNSNGWVFPSGEAKEIEADTYVTKAGFGHEEWLFNFAWLIEGYHYAFLQPVGNSAKRVAGKTLDILLYAINANHDRVYVDEIKNCRVLSRQQAEAALKHYKMAGWLKSMKEQITTVGGDSSKLDGDGENIFNVRFRPSDVKFERRLRLADSKDFVNKLNRYTLTEADQQIVETQWRRRRGTKTAPTVHTITRSGQPGVIYDPIHASLQGELFELLKIRFGKEKVVLEADFVDITILEGKKQTLIEIKSDGDARAAIRKALGQILEYAYFNPDQKYDNLDLVIVAPGPTTQRVADYLKLLYKKFGIPVDYCSFSLGDKLPKRFSESAAAGP